MLRGRTLIGISVGSKWVSQSSGELTPPTQNKTIEILEWIMCGPAFQRQAGNSLLKSNEKRHHENQLKPDGLGGTTIFDH